VGIAPVVPAHIIKDIICQQDSVDMMNKVNAEMRAKNQKGAKLDFADTKKPEFTKDDFESALKKVSRKTTTKGTQQ
jgi:hypothetical protein